ncbi:IclR family transcriptional regulator [Streptomyces sp. NBC_00873]|uniref:IclR family transcriptional regulator n=1 Tax=unclassified Streptomyces TaxID=2593676 RepID=UPI00386E2213|nr:IclR family transcriptional regulator [Streptomyces sp. NBC_00873]WSY96743.1 IclR family transcriptional regulator [Streptomyces sp. NBC_00873]WTA41483.1 IclR family transcriptional regulator [Streptomyces sp. NBC_00842]WTA48413.1 IclR family transcriptional regulator [Streptomyces sp. NBC_00842]
MTTHPSVPERSAVDRTLGVLSAFDRRNRVLTLSGISRRSGLPVATAHRIVTKLHRLGALGRTADGQYSIGLRLWETGTLALRCSLVSEIAQPALVDLHSQTAAAALLTIRDGDETVCLSFVSRDPGHASAPGARGRRQPLHTTAQGLVLLAHANAGAADQPVTGLGSAELQHSLAKIRRQGYAVTVGTVSPETAELAAPIRDALGTVVAAVGVVTPVETFRPLRLAPPVLAAAEAVSRRVQASRGPDWWLDEQALPGQPNPYDYDVPADAARPELPRVCSDGIPTKARSPAS